jgi:hypothetical protein
LIAQNVKASKLPQCHDQWHDPANVDQHDAVSTIHDASNAAMNHDYDVARCKTWDTMFHDQHDAFPTLNDAPNNMQNVDVMHHTAVSAKHAGTRFVLSTLPRSHFHSVSSHNSTTTLSLTRRINTFSFNHYHANTYR